MTSSVPEKPLTDYVRRLMELEAANRRRHHRRPKQTVRRHGTPVHCSASNRRFVSIHEAAAWAKCAPFLIDYAILRHQRAAGMYWRKCSDTSDWRPHGMIRPKPVAAIDEDGNRTVYPSMTAAVQAMGGAVNSIWSALTKNVPYRRRRWEYVEQVVVWPWLHRKRGAA